MNVFIEKLGKLYFFFVFIVVFIIYHVFVDLLNLRFGSKYAVFLASNDYFIVLGGRRRDVNARSCLRGKRSRTLAVRTLDERMIDLRDLDTLHCLTRLKENKSVKVKVTRDTN